MNKYLAYLHSIGITQKKFFDIFYNNLDYEKFYNELSYELLKKYNFADEKIKEIIENKNKLNTDFLDKKILDLSIKIYTHLDDNYPKLLKEIKNKPFLIYIRGEINGEDNFFGVVGSRKISPYTKKAANIIINDLLNHFTIVSGGAGGCDTLAHEIAINNNKKTIVVFGTGIDIYYPVTNYEIYEKIINSFGALLSIFPIGTHGANYTFPIRNEIVAGMCQGTLILQAGEKSGTLITANLVLENSRDLFTIPGDIFNNDFVGNNNLIKTSQAKLITNSQDILEEYDFKVCNNKNINLIFENTIQEGIYNILKYNLSLSLDEIMYKTGYDYPEISFNLSILEMKQIIKKDLFSNYSI